MAQQPESQSSSAIPEPPFTDADLLLAHRMIMTSDEAKAAVRELRNDQASARRLMQAGTPPVVDIALTGDVLVLLSLLNDALDAKVSRFRHSRGAIDPEAERWWKERRDELRPLVRQRLAELRASGELK